MKFGKTLQGVSQVCDPSWLPFFMNYKLCKKVIKKMSDSESLGDIALQERAAFEAVFGPKQAAALLSTVDPKTETTQKPVASRGARLIDSPREVKFFTLLHAELRKTSWFFQKIEDEFALKEEQMQASVYLTRNQAVKQSPDQRGLLLNSMDRLYHNLLLLETYAIMTYCAFSKILKKHDKVIGYPTRIAFMSTFVNKASFASYPRLAAMIGRCERLRRELSNETEPASTGRVIRVPIQEDELLFINLVQQIHHEAAQTASKEGVVVSQHGQSSSLTPT